MTDSQNFSKTNYSYKPLTESTWDDFTLLFGERGASSGCWCMWWRTADKKEFENNKGNKNKETIRQLVLAGGVPGIIGYDKMKPIGWCSVAPREQFPGLDRTRRLQKIDDQPVWSIVCLFVDKTYRRSGVTELLLLSAIEHVKNNDGKIIEAYPADPKGETIAAFINAGFRSTYSRVGFQEVLRRGSRPIMRLQTN